MIGYKEGVNAFGDVGMGKKDIDDEVKKSAELTEKESGMNTADGAEVSSQKSIEPANEDGADKVCSSSLNKGDVKGDGADG